MTTATTARPTTDEIRASIDRRLAEPIGGTPPEANPDIRRWVRFLIQTAADPLRFPAMHREFWLDHEADPFDDESPWGALSADEAASLEWRAAKAVERAAARCEAVIVEELVTAGVAFTLEHPDAARSNPRGR